MDCGWNNDNSETNSEEIRHELEYNDSGLIYKQRR